MKRSTRIAARLRRGSPSFYLALALAAALVLTPKLVFAEPQVQGTPDAVRIDAQNASIDEIMAALGRSFDLHYTSSVRLEQPLTGVYEGSLKRVVARLLAGHNFVLKISDGRIDVTIFAPSRGARAVASSGSPAQKIAAQKPVGRPAAPPASPSQKVVAGKPVERPDATPADSAQQPPSNAPLNRSSLRLAASSDVAPPVPDGVGQSKGPGLQPSTMTGPTAKQGSGPNHGVPVPGSKSGGPEISATAGSQPASLMPHSPSLGDESISSPK